MNAFTRIAAVALLGTGFAAAASAEEWTGPRVVGSGENASVVYASPSQNIVGGALTRTTGSGEGATTEVVTSTGAQPGRLVRTTGSGENQDVMVIEAPVAQRLAGAGARG
jgi:hypothetical protein